MQAQLNEEYHDPHDDWSARDIVLALMPLIIATALQASFAMQHKLLCELLAG